MKSFEKFLDDSIVVKFLIASVCIPLWAITEVGDKHGLWGIFWLFSFFASFPIVIGIYIVNNPPPF